MLARIGEVLSPQLPSLVAHTRRALEADADAKEYEHVDMELAVEKLLGEVAPLLVQHVAQEVDGGRVRNEHICPTCGGPMSFVQKTPRLIEFLFGPARVVRARFNCKRCHKGRAPLEYVWGLQSGPVAMGKRRLTPRAQLNLITLSVATAYGTACDHLARLKGTTVCAMTAWRYTQRLGKWLRRREEDGQLAVPFRGRSEAGEGSRAAAVAGSGRRDQYSAVEEGGATQAWWGCGFRGRAR